MGATAYPYNSQLPQLDAQQMTQSYSGNPQYLQMLPVVSQGYGTESNLNRYPLTPGSFPMVSPQSPFFFMNATQAVDHHEMSDPYVAIPVHQQSMQSASPFISTSTSPYRCFLNKQATLLLFHCLLLLLQLCLLHLNHLHLTVRSQLLHAG